VSGTALVFSAFAITKLINQSQALASGDCVRGEFDELLRISFEIVQPSAFGQNASNRFTGQLRSF